MRQFSTAIHLRSVLGPWNVAAMVAAAVVIGGTLAGGWISSRSSAVATATPAIMTEAALRPADTQCGGGDPVSAFKCRNTWYANLKSSYR